MLKNRFLTAFAFAGLVGFAACAAEDEGAEFETETAPLEETTPAPEITPQPVTVDTMTTMPGDTMAPADSATL